MTGKASTVATVESENEHQFRFPYQGGTKAAIGITKRTNGEDLVLATLSKGQISCSVTGCTIRVRFDDRPAKEFAANNAPGVSDVMGFENSKEFLAELKGSETVKLELPVFREGDRIFDFRVAGLTWE